MPTQPGASLFPPSRLRALAGIALVSLLGACAASPDGAPPGTTQAPGDAVLVDTDWQLEQWSGHLLPQDSGGLPVVLRFAAQDGNGHVSGRAGCNRFNAAYSVTSPGSITIDQAASTRMACPGPLMQFEAAYLEALSTLRAYQVSTTRLVLRDAAGNVQQYRALTSAPPAAQQVDSVSGTQVSELYVAPVRARCTGVAPMECLQVRRAPTGPWERWYAPIEGFDFQTGTAYRIRIVGTPVANPPADGSNMRWKLEQILEQHRAGPRRATPAADKQ